MTSTTPPSASETSSETGSLRAVTSSSAFSCSTSSSAPSAYSTATPSSPSPSSVLSSIQSSSPSGLPAASDSAPGAPAGLVAGVTVSSVFCIAGVVVAAVLIYRRSSVNKGSCFKCRGVCPINGRQAPMSSSTRNWGPRRNVAGHVADALPTHPQPEVPFVSTPATTMRFPTSSEVATVVETINPLPGIVSR